MQKIASALAIIAVAFTAHAQPPEAAHRLVIHVNGPAKGTMEEALHNARNVIEYYRAHGGTVAVEIVANGDGTTMFVNGISPVASDLPVYYAKFPELTFDACAISLRHTEQALGRKLEVVSEARIVPSGAVRILELEEQHWAYLKP